jgi:putative Mn2+ efflux pump MntP
MARVLAVAAPLGLSNFAGGVAIGLDRLSARQRLRAAATFAAFEAAMPLLGLAIGRGVAGSLGASASLIGGLALVGLGVWLLVVAVVATRRADDAARPSWTGRRVAIAGAALSLDNLVVGFALGAVRVPVVVSAIVIGVVSGVLSLIGLELGHRAGRRIDGPAEALSAVGLVVVGALVALDAL